MTTTFLPRERVSRLGRAVAAVTAAVLMSACGAGSSTTPAVSASGTTSGSGTAAAPGTASAAARTSYPLTVTNCGKPVTFAKAPERVVTLDPNVTETLLLLGLQDRIVGMTQFQKDDEMWPPTKTVMKTLKVVNDPNVGYPSKETILSLSPDFVTSEYPSALQQNDTLPDLEGWKRLNVNPYLTTNCSEAVWHDFGPLYATILDYGKIFDVQDKAASVVADLQARVKAGQDKLAAAKVPTGLSITMHDGEKEHPGTLGLGVSNAMIELAGDRYALIKDDTGATAVSWETWVKRDGDVVWRITGLGATEDQITKQLETDPRLASVKAVQKKAFVSVSYDDASDAPRAVDGFEQLVDGLVALKLS